MKLIAAMTRDRVIGKDNRLPWRLPEDLKLFKRLTTGHTVVMGKNTWQSIGRPLPGRNNVVISRTLPETEGVYVCRSLEEGLDQARAFGKEIFIIGGAEIYRQTLPMADTLYLSCVQETCQGDTYFPPFDEDEWQEQQRTEYDGFTQVIYVRKAGGLHHGDTEARRI